MGARPAAVLGRVSTYSAMLPVGKTTAILCLWLWPHCVLVLERRANANLKMQRRVHTFELLQVRGVGTLSAVIFTSLAR